VLRCSILNQYIEGKYDILDLNIQNTKAEISSSQYKHEKLYNGHHKIQNKLAVKKMA
jgi:hypothetical protein